jgi:hypothetical protein
VTPECARFDAVVDDVAASGDVPPDLRGHVAGCGVCQSRLELARQVEHVLTTWPVETPSADFATAVMQAARREAWAQEVVVDWGFNLALAGSLAVILGGLVGLAWILTAAADASTTARLVGDTTGWLVEGAVARAPLLGAATVLLATALGGWWWAEHQARW